MSRSKNRRIVVKNLGRQEASRAARYIAGEGSVSRGGGSGGNCPLFSRDRDDLAPGEADQALGEAGSVNHFLVLVAPGHRLLEGRTNRLKAERLRSLTRRLLSAAFAGDGAPRWVAGVHLDTEVVHIHVALPIQG